MGKYNKAALLASLDAYIEQEKERRAKAMETFKKDWLAWQQEAPQKLTDSIQKLTLESYLEQLEGKYGDFSLFRNMGVVIDPPTPPSYNWNDKTDCMIVERERARLALMAESKTGFVNLKDTDTILHYAARCK